MFSRGVEEVMKEVCLEIEKRYEIKFLEIGADNDHVHFISAKCAEKISK